MNNDNKPPTHVKFLKYLDGNDNLIWSGLVPYLAAYLEE